MYEVELDDGYPTEETEKAIAAWPFGEYLGMMEQIRQAWHFGDWGWSQEDEQTSEKNIRRFTISTGGWGGNETLIGAMQDNRMFWMMCWQQSRRGGHYIFEVKL